MLNGKKAISSYIGWILLASFAVMMGVFMFGWINSQAETTTNALEERSDTAECESVGINLDDICQNSQTLNMNISNVRLLGITELKFRFYDLYDNTESRQVNITIRPGEKESLEVLKQGTLKQAEIIPVTKQESRVITCTKSMITAENIKIC